jgi:hypothetical protein
MWVWAGVDGFWGGGALSGGRCLSTCMQLGFFIGDCGHSSCIPPVSRLPQVPIFQCLAKFNNEQVSDDIRAGRRRFRLTRLPNYLALQVCASGEGGEGCGSCKHSHVEGWDRCKEGAGSGSHACPTTSRCRCVLGGGGG